jgi:hypothetical protein
MKKKIIFAIATSFFAVATVFNMNLLQSSNAGDVSLESIAIMAQAQNGEVVVGPPCLMTCTMCWCAYLWADGSIDFIEGEIYQ